MRGKADNSKKIAAIEQWLQKKPLDHFSSRVTAPESLREPVKQLLWGAMQPAEGLCWMIDVPPQGMYQPRRAGGWLRRIWQLWELTPQRLVVLTDRRLILISTSSDGSPPQIASIPAENILYLEHSMILLFSWLRICWHENQVLREETIYFSSVDDSIFMPMIVMLRSLAAGRGFPAPAQTLAPPVSVSRGEKEKPWVAQCDRDALRQLPLKFLNLILLYGLLPDEHICQVLYRPAQRLKQFGRKRVKAPPQMVVACTDAYLLLAAENLTDTTGNYGLTLSFLPRRFVKDVSASGEGKQRDLHIALETRHTARDWSLPFPLEMEGPVRDFARNCMETSLAG